MLSISIFLFASSVSLSQPPQSPDFLIQNKNSYSEKIKENRLRDTGGIIIYPWKPKKTA